MQLDYSDWTINFNTKEDVEKFFNCLNKKQEGAAYKHYFGDRYPEIHHRFINNDEIYGPLLERLFDLMISRGTKAGEELSKKILAIFESDIIQFKVHAHQDTEFLNIIKDIEANYGISYVDIFIAYNGKPNTKNTIRDKQLENSPFILSYTKQAELEVADFDRISFEEFQESRGKYIQDSRIANNEILKKIKSYLVPPVKMSYRKFIPDDGENLAEKSLASINDAIISDIIFGNAEAIARLAKNYGEINPTILQGYIRRLPEFESYSFKIKSHSKSNFNEIIENNIEWFGVNRAHDYLIFCESIYLKKLVRESLYINAETLGFRGRAADNDQIQTFMFGGVLSLAENFYEAEFFEWLDENKFRLVYSHTTKKGKKISGTWDEILEKIDKIKNEKNREEEMEIFEDRDVLSFDRVEIPDAFLAKLPVVVNFTNGEIHSMERFNR
jgi:hypothetical protein